MLARLLSSKLLNRQARSIEHTIKINVDGGQVGHDKAGVVRIIGDECPLTDPSYGIDIVQPSEICDCLAKGFGLRIPIGDVDVGCLCHDRPLIQFVDDFLGAFEISIGNEDFDTIGVC